MWLVGSEGGLRRGLGRRVAAWARKGGRGMGLAEERDKQAVPGVDKHSLPARWLYAHMPGTM
eukprot:352240-Chlamydomonas_euryale.AAC.3